MEKLVLTNNMLSTIKQSLLNGITVASGSKTSATYYHKGKDQAEAIMKEVERLYSLSKELPLIIASQKGTTGAFATAVLLNEFKHTLKGGACNIVNPIDWYDNGLSDKAVLSTLNGLGENGITYVLRLFMDLKKEKVNNERTRKIVLGYLWGQQNLEFYALKYRNKIAKILKHTYGVRKCSILLSIARKQVNLSGSNIIGTEKEHLIANEFVLRYFNGNSERAFKILLFIFRQDDNVDYNVTTFPLLSEYQKAKTDITGIKTVPEEVLIGLISSVNHPQYHSMWSNAVQREATKALIRKNVTVTSVNQQVRQTKSTAKLGVEKTVDVTKATDFLALYKTGYETGSFTPEVLDAIDKLAEKKKIDGFFYQNIGVIVDDSNSMTGNKAESKNTPKAIVDFTAKVLGKSARKAMIVKTEDEFTDLATAFVELLKKERELNPEVNANEAVFINDGSTEYNAIFVLTDGYENAYDGLTNEVISLWKRETGRDIPIFQISPYTSAEMGANVRQLGEGVVTLAINNPVALQPQINARLLEIDTKRWLENQLLALEGAPIKRNKKITVNA